METRGMVPYGPIIKDYRGFPIEFELIEGQLMANATAMCAPFGKKPYDWQRSALGARYIAALEAKREFPALVETRQGGNSPGTWIHERLILKLAQWLDVEFEIWCDEQVAELLRTGKNGLAAPTPAEYLLLLAQQGVEAERRLKALEQQADTQQAQVRAIEQRVTEVVAKVTTINNDYYTIAGYATLLRRQIPSSEANKLGRRAAKLSQQEGIALGKTADQRYGSVNTYHKAILARILF